MNVTEDNTGENQNHINAPCSADRHRTDSLSKGRVVSERRKAQNRRAQKNYREKKKSRLQQLENIAGHSPSWILSRYSSLLQSPDSQPGHHQAQYGPDAYAFEDKSQRLWHSDPYAFADGSVHLPLGVDMFQVNPETEHPSNVSLDFNLTFPQTDEMNFLLHDTCLPSNSVIDSRVIQEALLLSHPDPSESLTGTYEGSCRSQPGLAPSTSTTGAESISSNCVDSANPIFSIEENQGLGDAIQRLLLIDDRFDSAELSKLIVQQRLTLADIIQAGLHAISSRSLQKERPQPTKISNYIPLPIEGDGNTEEIATEKRNTQLQEQPPGQSVSDIYRNNIQISYLSFVAACLANAPIIGVDPAKACGPHSVSPFYEAGLNHLDIPAVQLKFSGVTEHLQPCSMQVIVQHRVYIDLLPFPNFRERLLSLKTCSPHIIDEDELCRDLRNNGLVCWGSSSQAGGGCPWDARSWEVQPWFLKKWWLILGDATGELARQSKWWCEMRGQRFSYDA